jgi:hypothetical protein
MPFLKIWVIHKKSPCFPRCSNLLDHLSQDVPIISSFFHIFAQHVPNFFPQIFFHFPTIFQISSHFPGIPQVFSRRFSQFFPERTSHFRCRPRWFLEEAAGFLAKELRDWSQAWAIHGGMGWGYDHRKSRHPWEHDGYYMELIWNIMDGDMEN